MNRIARITAIGLSWVILITAVAPGRVWALSIGKEKELAKEFLASVRKQMVLIEDPICISLVRDIGNEFISQLPPQPFEFKFYLVDIGQFNAFAGPGANIFVNRGLITGLDNASELAGILSHEIAHATCRHVAQLVDKSKLVSIGTLAGVLAGVLLGAGGGGGEAAQTLIIGSAAAGQSAMLAYTREHEEEADQKGLKYMEKSSFSGDGLLTGLEKIRHNDWYGSEKIPGYLKTHPGTKERIIYIESWIAEHPESLKSGSNIDPVRFDMVKARLSGLYGKPDNGAELFEKALSEDGENPTFHYGLALALSRLSRLSEAESHLRQALKKRPFDPLILLEMGRVFILQGEYQKALEVLGGLEDSPAIGTQAIFYQGEAEMELGMLKRAKKNFEQIMETAAAIFPKSFYHMARISGQEGNAGYSHYYLGRYYKEIADNDNALFHFKRSLTTLSDPEKRAEVDTLMKEMEKKDKKEKG